MSTDPTTAAACEDRKSTRLNSSHTIISYAVFCLKKKKKAVESNDSREGLRIGVSSFYTPPPSSLSFSPTLVPLDRYRLLSPSLSYFFFFNDTATTEIYTLSLHDALPI